MQKIINSLIKTINLYNMIEEGDKIAVCLSGGKDSFTLLLGLKAIQRFYKNHFDLIAISIDPGFDFFDSNFIKKRCDEIGVPLFIEKTNIKEVVFDIRKEQNPCSLCANIRRGAINSIAIREHCNKIALGHNEDDCLETFILNFLYAGKLTTFSPTSYMDRSKITLIRPLIDTSEKDIKNFIKRNNIPVMDKVCPMDGNSKRESIKEMISNLESEIPTVKSHMIGAIKRSNLTGWK